MGCQRVQQFPFPRWAPTHFASIFRNALDLFTLSFVFRQTCFARCLVTRNLHETLSRFKNNSRRITYGIGRLWGMPSLSPLSSLGCRLLANEKIPDNEHNVFNKLQKSESIINVGIIFFFMYFVSFDALWLWILRSFAHEDRKINQSFKT